MQMGWRSLCAVLEQEQWKVSKLVLVGVMQLDLGFRKIVLATLSWEIITSKLKMMSNWLQCSVTGREERDLRNTYEVKMDRLWGLVKRWLWRIECLGDIIFNRIA